MQNFDFSFSFYDYIYGIIAHPRIAFLPPPTHRVPVQVLQVQVLQVQVLQVQVHPTMIRWSS